MIEFDKSELMNEYVQKQNRMIGELVNKNLMLEAQLAVAQRIIEQQKAKGESSEVDNTQAYK
jgi:hypothetical protein|tara:strand:- start:1122 stop:1307 length:186 start_codon:yes stop_codon:yes gene_type:complete